MIFVKIMVRMMRMITISTWMAEWVSISYYQTGSGSMKARISASRSVSQQLPGCLVGWAPPTAGLAGRDWLSRRHIAQFSALIGWPGPAGAELRLPEIWPAGAGLFSRPGGEPALTSLTAIMDTQSDSQWGRLKYKDYCAQNIGLSLYLWFYVILSWWCTITFALPSTTTFRLSSEFSHFNFSSA